MSLRERPSWHSVHSQTDLLFDLWRTALRRLHSGGQNHSSEIQFISVFPPRIYTASTFNNRHRFSPFSGNSVPVECLLFLKIWEWFLNHSTRQKYHFHKENNNEKIVPGLGCRWLPVDWQTALFSSRSRMSLSSRGRIFCWVTAITFRWFLTPLDCSMPTSLYQNVPDTKD